MVSVSPIAGLPGYNWSRDSTPRTTTRRPSFSSSSLIKPPSCTFSDAAPQCGPDGLDQVRFGFDRVCILDRQANRAAGCVSSGLFAGAAAPDYGEIDGDCLEVVFLVAAESLAQTNQENDRSDAPNNAEHGQEAAQFVRGDGGDGLTQNFPDVQEPNPPLFGRPGSDYGSRDFRVNHRDGAISASDSPGWLVRLRITKAETD